MKVRKYRGMRTPTGIRTRNAMAASRPWSLTLFSYSDSPVDIGLADSVVFESAEWWDVRRWNAPGVRDFG
jgi:hypothetical protein